MRLNAVRLIETAVVALLVASITAMPSWASAYTPVASPCNCVIFRLDDVVDGSMSNVIVAIMDHFLAENKSLSVQIIVSNFGNQSYSNLYNKTLEGYRAGLFEIGIHHWGREEYDKADYDTQVRLLNTSNDKLQALFGSRAILFAPPHNEFNADTIRAMGSAGISTFSTTYLEERTTPNPYKISAALDTGSSMIQLSQVNGSNIFHVPVSVSYLGLIQDGYSGERLTNETMRRAELNIEKYGFTIIALHPTDFAARDPSANQAFNQVHPSKFQVLVDTIDRLESKGYPFGNITSVLP